ncbi:MAG: hypothetical protein DKM50_03580 [Candidatus Margulisiibacteriota bacterium]|nr:MAG: hypothetical protein A2X43_08045 [Candidatus Margulisbacteria bacterium GWD2_39_127]PZM82218.1 MAG: hypothetical protein DKM50_03580 [Candidatus Margulisiibacteriota bacterium]HAR63741.1 hypothetical protein [Candidatus Margulisiibacteriota bacterium]
MAEIQGASYNEATKTITIGNDFDWGNLSTDSDTELIDQMGITDTENLTIVFNDDDGVNSTNKFTVSEAGNVVIDNDGTNSVKAQANLRVQKGGYGSVTIHDTMDAGTAGMSENLEIGEGLSATVDRNQVHTIGNASTTIDRNISGQFSYSANNTTVQGNITAQNMDASGEAVVSSAYTLNDNDEGGTGSTNINFNVSQTYNMGASTENAAELNAVNAMEINITGAANRTYNVSGDINQNLNFSVGEALTDRDIMMNELKVKFLELFNNFSLGSETSGGGTPTGYIDKNNQYNAFTQEELSQLSNGKISDELMNKMAVEKNGSISVSYATEKPEIPHDFFGFENGKIQLGSDFFNSDGTLNSEKFMQAYFPLTTQTGNAQNQDLLAQVTVGSDGTIQLNATSQVVTGADANVNVNTILNNCSSRQVWHDDVAMQTYYSVTLEALKAGGVDTSKIPGKSDTEKSQWVSQNIGEVNGQFGLQQALARHGLNVGGVSNSAYASTTFGALRADHVITSVAEQRTVNGISWNAVAASSDSNAGQWTTTGGNGRGANALMITGPDGKDLGMAILSWNGREFLTESTQNNFNVGRGDRLQEATVTSNIAVSTLTVNINDISSSSTGDTSDTGDSGNSIPSVDGNQREISSETDTSTMAVKTYSKLTSLEHDPVNHLSINIKDKNGNDASVNSTLSVNQNTQGTAGTSLAGGSFVAGNKLMSNINMTASQNTKVTVDGDSVDNLQVRAANVTNVSGTTQSIQRENTGKAVTGTEQYNLTTKASSRYAGASDKNWINQAQFESNLIINDSFDFEGAAASLANQDLIRTLKENQYGSEDTGIIPLGGAGGKV